MENKIPGWMSTKELKILSTLAGLVPHKGSILELGCFLGRTTRSLYLGKHDSVDLTVVDTFNFNTWIDETTFGEYTELFDHDVLNHARTIAKTSGCQEAFKFCVGEEIYSNLIVNQSSTKNFQKNKNYNLTFIDASHKYEDVAQDLEKYSSENNLIVGDDFYPRWQGVVTAINQYRDRRTLITFEDTKLWVLVPKFGYWRDIFKNNNLLFLD
jgi:predicted O-methyltransferase YrrM